MRFNTVYIERSVRGSRVTSDILSRNTYREKKIISSSSQMAALWNFEQSIPSQKKNLLIAENTGAFIKKCVRDKEKINKNEYLLYLFSGCPMDCQYCYLQDYLDIHIPVVFANRGMFYDQAKVLLSSGEHIILHAGEACDPFAMERISPYLEELIRFFIPWKKSCLEIRSKTIPPSSFYECRGAPHILISQTLSPEEDIRRFEKGTSGIASRIQVLKRVRDTGFSIGLRFDPVIIRSKTLESYAMLFERIFSILPPEDVASVSLGALRFTKDLFRITRLRFPLSGLTASEWSLSQQKIKYFLPLRVKLYTGLVSLLKKYIKRDFSRRVSICMDRELEKKIMEPHGLTSMAPWNPPSPCGLRARSVQHRIPLCDISPKPET
ncbi:MAG: hypothetical protein JW928_02150, partial [Candidatus Aureabacteria bacterium]|nr:hypothetical protein [Candidatus Auribacterota bacterium]